MLGFFAGFYYWWPKVFGKCLNEKLGKWNFWLMIIGMNLTFGPMHIIGLQGQPRRMYVWTEDRAGEGFFNLGFWNLVAVDRRVHPRHRRAAVPHQRRPHPPQGAGRAARPVGRPHARVDDDAARRRSTTSTPSRRCTRSTSSSTASTRTSARATHHDLRQVATAEEILAEQEANADHHIHMPSPSYWPLVLAFVAADHRPTASSTTACIGVVGAAILLLAAFGWALEPSVADDSDYDPPAGRRAGHRAGDGRESSMSDEADGATPPEEKTPGHGAPDLGNEPSRRRSSAIVETIDEIPMGGVPEPGRGADRRHRRGAHAASPTCPRRRPSATPTAATPRRPGCPTTSWRCGCSSARSACCSAA